jgi:hypothetical protein
LRCSVLGRARHCPSLSNNHRWSAAAAPVTSELTFSSSLAPQTACWSLIHAATYSVRRTSLCPPNHSTSPSFYSVQRIKNFCSRLWAFLAQGFELHLDFSPIPSVKLACSSELQAYISLSPPPVISLPLPAFTDGYCQLIQMLALGALSNVHGSAQVGGVIL